MTEIKRGPTDYMAEAVNAYIRENAEQRAEIERLQTAIQAACDLLAERTQGSSSRSSGHNARLLLEAALIDKRSAP